MASKIKLLRSSVPGKKPTAAQFDEGQIALNTADGKIFMKQADGTVREVTKQIHDGNTSITIDESGAGTIVMSADGSNVQEINDSFTKIKVPLIVEDSNSITISEGDENAANKISIKIPTNLTGSYDFILPTTQGVEGQVLRTDGSGNLNWTKLAPGTRTIQVAKSGSDDNDGINAPVLTIERACQIASGLTYAPKNTPTAAQQDAYDLLLANKTYIQAETLAYVENNFDFQYDQAKCERDTGIIIDAASYDLALGTNYNQVTAGLAYTRVNSEYLLNNQKTQTIGAIEFARDEAAGYITDAGNTATSNQAFDEVVDILTNGVGNANAYTFPAGPSTIQDEIDAKDQLQANRDFLRNEVTAYINDTYPNFGYDKARCQRDVGYILDAISIDQATASNYNTVTAGLAYQRANASDVTGAQLTETVGALTYLRTLLENDTVSDNTSGERTSDLLAEVIDILQNGENAADTLIYPVPATLPSTYASEARDRLYNNKAFIQAEIIAYIDDNYPALVYDDTLCSRDVGYIVDALQHDILYGGDFGTIINARAYFAGTLSQLGAGQQAATVDAYQHLANIVSDVVLGNAITKTTGNALNQDTSGDNASATEATTLDGLVQIIEDVISAGNLNSLPSATLPSLTWTSAVAQTTYTEIQTDKASLQQAVTDYIDETYSYYNQDKCSRDVGYIIDALCYDIMYGGNSATVRAADAYWVGATTQVAGQQTETSAAIGHLSDVIIDVVQGVSVTPTVGNSLTQNTASGNATSTQATALDNLLAIIEDVIINGTINLPVVQYPDLSSVTTPAITSFNELQSARAAIIVDTINFIETTYDTIDYDEAICYRDAGYIVESIAYDILYGGNQKSVRSAERYFIGAVSVLPADQVSPTADAVEYLRDLSNKVVQNDTTGTRWQTVESQVLDTTKTNGSGSTTTITTLADIIADAIRLGLASLPTEVDPQYTVTPVTIQVSSGDYIENNPIIIPDFCTVIGDSLRNCIIRPNNPLRDMFRVRDGVYFAQFTFRDKLTNLGVPNDTFDYAVSYDDIGYPSDVERFDYPELPYQKTLITASPYIQNCSIISFLGANGIKNDGSKVRRPNVPANQIESENPPVGDVPEQNPSMVANAFTMLSFGGTGWRVMNEAYSQVVSCFQIFCKNGSYAQSGGYLSITNSATNFGLYALRASGYRTTAFNFDRGLVATNGVEGSFTTFDVMGFDRRPVEHFILRFRNANLDDITDNFKTSITEQDFTADNTVLDLVNNKFLITGHGYINGERILYRANGNNEIFGLLDNAYYYVETLTSDEFRLYEEESLSEAAVIQNQPGGTHTFVADDEEYYIEEVLSSSNRYQTLTVSGNGLQFNTGQEITATVGDNTTNAYVYSWNSGSNALVVSLNEVSVNGLNTYVDFVAGATITVDALGNTDIPVTAATDKRDKFSATLKIKSTSGGSTVNNVAQTAGLNLYLHRPSIVNSSAHTWEYAGSGTDYNALPANGGQTNEDYEQFQDLPGRVYTSGTNELGDFKVGGFITAENRTGNVTFTNRVSIAQLDSISLSLSDVTIEEISDDPGLGDNDPGGPSNNRITTQLAQRTFMDNRLGDFLDKSVATSAVPGAVVQLNASGQLNADLIPPTRAFSSFNVEGFEKRLELVDDIPPQEVLGGDIVIEVYQQQSVAINQPVTLAKGTKITQPNTAAVGYLKEDVTAGQSLTLVNVEGTFVDGAANTLEQDSGDSTVFETQDPGVYVTNAGTKAEFQDNYFLSDDTESQFLVINDAQDSTRHDFGVGLTVIAASNKAQGTVTEYREGVVSLVDFATIAGSGYLTNNTYFDVPLSGGTGTGARADITISSGEVTIVDLVRGGSGYVVGDTLSIANDADIGGRSGGTPFTVQVDEIENRLYVTLSGNFIKFSASDTNTFKMEDDNSPSQTLNSLAGFTAIQFSANSLDGEINYGSSTIVEVGHGLGNGDPLEYDPNGNNAIGGLLTGEVYYVKVIDVDTFELYTNYALGAANKVSFSSSSVGTHIFRRRTVSIKSDRLLFENHGYATGDILRVNGTDLPGGLEDGEFYSVGSVTVNAFTLHAANSDALVSVSGTTQAQVNITGQTGTGSMSFTLQNVTVSGVTNTSSNNIDNYSSLSGSNIDADNIISGIISPTRLGIGTANTDTFLRGDSSYAEVVTTLRIDNTSALNIIGNSKVVGGQNRFYGDLEVDIRSVQGNLGDLDYTNLGIASFNKNQFTVSQTGEVDITSSADGGTLDAASLGGNPASYFINPENFNRAVPINKGGTNLQNYTAGDLLYAAVNLSSNTDSLSRLPIGVAGAILTVENGVPTWSNSLSIDDVQLTGDLDVDGVLFVDTVNNRVGINDTTPSISLDITGTDAIKVPVGSDAQRPVGVNGYIRYNTTSNSFEGYAANAWSSLGGVKDVDQDTYIKAEVSPGTDEDTLYFYNAGTLTTQLGADGFTTITVDDITINDNIITVDTANTNLELSGNGTGAVYVNDELQVVSTTRLQNTLTTDLGAVLNDTNGATGDVQVKGQTEDHLIFVDASEDKVGIAQSNPQTTLQIKDFGFDSETTTLATVTPTAIMEFAAADFRTAKLIIQITNTVTGEYQSEEVMLVHDGSAVEFVEYGIIFTGSARLAAFSASITSGTVGLIATGATADNQVYKVVKTMITD